MKKIQGLLVFFVSLLVILIFYTYVSGAHLGIWLKGLTVVCVILLFIRFIVKYKMTDKKKDSK